MAQNKGTQQFEVDFFRYIPAEHRAKLKDALELALNGYSYSTISRRLRGFRLIASWLAENRPNTNLWSKDIHFHVHEWLRERLGSSDDTGIFLTRHDDWAAARALLSALMSQRALPRFQLPPLHPEAAKLTRITKVEKDVLDKLPLTKRELQILGEPATGDAAFFETIEAKCHALYRAVRAQALLEIREAAANFDRGKKLVSDCDIGRLRTLKAEGLTTDPLIRTGGQKLSYFSAKHPDGLKNLVGWASHENRGILYERSFTGATHVTNHDGKIERVRMHLGLTLQTTAPIFAFLVLDQGLNVDSLQQAKVSTNAKDVRLLSKLDDNLYKLSVPKLRAHTIIERIARKGSEFGAIEVVELLLSLSERWRNELGLDDVWLHHGNAKLDVVTPITPTAFKFEHAKFMARVPGIESLATDSITRADLRQLAGLCRWFETGGNMLETARLLNNSPRTAIRNYIPEALQKAYYAFKIRKFQNLLIHAATLQDEELARRAMRYESLDQLRHALDAMLMDKTLSASELFRAASEVGIKKSQSGDVEKVVFLMNTRNVAVLSRFNSEIQRTQKIHPEINVEEKLASSLNVGFWRDVWQGVSFNMQGTLDRGLRNTWLQGEKLAADQSFEVTFPCLALPADGARP